MPSLLPNVHNMLIALQVSSPFQGILDYEKKHGIPIDWINYAIRFSSPNGYWQRLERGEIKMDSEFFKGFTTDLHNMRAWNEFHNSSRREKSLKDVFNSSQLGDPGSLKAEAADSSPTDQDRGAQSFESSSNPCNSLQKIARPSLSKLAKDTTIGDPVSLEAEEVVEFTPQKDRYDGASHRESTEPIVPPFSDRSDSTVPPLPSIDGESLFWTMMSASRHRDPYIFPALQRLRAETPRPTVAALSNTVVYPPDHPWSPCESSSSSPIDKNSNAFLFNPRDFFDVYIASAEVGMRKPSRDIFELTIKKLDQFDRGVGGTGVKGEDIVFLDDIGENLKTGKAVGMRTIRVLLGKTWRAVKELEGILEMELMEETTRRAKM